IRSYLHSGLVAYQGEKMSKSLGNLVFVSTLLDQGIDARAIRLVLLDHHYRQEWEYTEPDLHRAEQRLQRWRSAVATHTGQGEDTVAEMRRALAEDLDTVTCLQVVDEAAARGPLGDAVVTAVDALLGVDLRS